MAGLTYHNWYSCLTIEHEKEGTEACSRIDAMPCIWAMAVLKEKGVFGRAKRAPHWGVQTSFRVI